MANFCSECGKPVNLGAEFCTQCGHSLTGKEPAQRDLQQKRERVLGTQRSSGKKWSTRITFAAIIIVGVLWFYANLPDSGNPVIKSLPVITELARYPTSGQQMSDIPVTVEDGSIRLPLDVVKQMKFVAFNYVTPTTVVPLLAYVSGEGKIVTAVSMCEPCNSTRFHIQGDKLICNSCGTTWELNNLEAVSGSCGRYPPDALPNVVVGNQIQIDAQTVVAWQRRI
jgi:uncharacterized protein